MKFRKISSAVLAAALMATSTAIVASADDYALNGAVEFCDFGAAVYGMGTTNWFWKAGGQAVLADDGTMTITADPSLMNEKGDPTVEFGLQFYLSTVDGAADLDLNDSWSATIEYKITAASGTIKEETTQVKKTVAKNQYAEGIEGAYTLYKANISKDELAAYGEITATIKVTDFKYTKGGVEANVGEAPAAAETSAAETEAPVETPAETTAAETDTTADPSIDLFADYNKSAAHEKNLAFKFGQGTIDLYDAVGDDWDKLAKIEIDFTWTPGEKWCGGCGIGAAVINGETWAMGPEIGAANANEALAPDGKATQVVLDITDTPITNIASYDEKTGVVSFGELQIQDWWNGAAAGVKVEKIRFLAADGSTISELDYTDKTDGDLVYAPNPTAGDVNGATDSSKGSPDTGVADVAAVAGLAVAAAGAFVLSKKRK